MMQRWEQVVCERVPYTDQADVFELTGRSRQFAPEYAQQIYLGMLKQE